MKREPFGGGKRREVSVSGFDTPVETRWGLVSCPIGTVTKGKRTGKVVVRFWNTKAARLARAETLSLDRTTDPTYQIVDDLYAAHRRCDQIMARYNELGELPEERSLHEAQDIAWQLNDMIMGMRTDTFVRIGPVIRKLAMALIRRVGKNPHDPFKKEISKDAHDILAVLDSKGRVNPSAKLSQVVAIRLVLFKRLMMIQGIKPNVIRLRAGFRALIDEAERLFAKTDDMLQSMMLLTALDLNPLVNQMTVVRLRDCADELDRLDIDPYRRSCHRMAKELRRAAEYLAEGRSRSAMTLVKRTRESLKLRRVRTNLELLISQLTELLYTPKRRLADDEAKLISNGMLRALQTLGSVDEYRFEHPVCRQAERILNDALSLLVSFRRKNIAGLAQLKDKLKMAAKLL